MNQQLFIDHNNTLTAKQHIEQWLKSGLTQSEYCRRWGINVSTFANWYQKYKRGQEFQSKALVEIKSPLTDICRVKDNQASINCINAGYKILGFAFPKNSKEAFFIAKLHVMAT